MSTARRTLRAATTSKRASEGVSLFSLTNLRGRILAIGGVIVVLLVAGVWVTLTHASAQQSAAGGKPAASRSTQAAAGGLTVVSETPASNSTGVNGASSIKIQFSAPLAEGSPLPTVTPAISGSWQGAGTSTLEFVPAAGFDQLTHVTVQIPGGPSGVRTAGGGLLPQTQQLTFETGGYKTGRLDELLAQLGYLPLTWTAARGVSVPAATDAAGQLAAAYDPPRGSYTWDSGYPSNLQAFWRRGSASGLIVQGAVMSFEANNGLTMDGIAGKQVWKALLKDVAADQKNPHGYTYALADEGNPETLTVWHNGQIVLHSLANTGIAAAPTTLGTAPVYLRYYYQVMKGTNPDGTKYADPVYYVSYFRSGEAVHYFPRGSYGFPQSLGCVELPWDSAKQVWPYMWYGTLVTVAPGSQTPSTSPTAPPA
jgi:peptidoglycan hydrolase-like protein with peptidoglycan-binding domain